MSLRSSKSRFDSSWAHKLNYSPATPLQNIGRISPAYQKRLLKLGLKTVADLLYHFPHRYDDFSNIKNIGDLKLNEMATVGGEIIEIKNIRTWKKRLNITEAYIQDKTGIIKAVWFNQPYLLNTIKQNDVVSLAGKVHLVRDFTESLWGKREQSKISNEVSYDKGLYLSNPAYEKLIAYNLKLRTDLRHTGGLIPVYPETAGLTSRWLRYVIKPLLPKFLPQIKDHLPLEVKRSQGLPDLKQAIEQIHFPKTKKHAAGARKRLAFDELFLIQLHALSQKQKWQEQKAPKIKFNETLIKGFVDLLPFKLTDAQRKSAWEILQDLEKSKPMNRLLEGDVGSGKTVVAALAALQVVNAGYQAAFMAPTEILARQHYDTICKLFAGLNIKIGLITGSEQTMNYELGIINYEKNKKNPTHNSSFIIHNSDILIGTHALIQKSIQFKNLALAVVDEQHRFGVEQRAALVRGLTPTDTQTDAEIPHKSATSPRQSAFIPHLLSMTATPIPRTLALTLYGDLDISLLDEMPKGRQEIITKIVSPDKRQAAYEFIRQQIKQGRQAFVICPRIESRTSTNTAQTDAETQRESASSPRQSVWLEVKAVKDEYEKLSQKMFPDLNIAMLHGKMKPKEKEKIMRDFAKGLADILVSTSVVEVGVDIPNTAIMMIEGAERFGLAQLHQFRGRVGRGKFQSYCLLFTTSGSDNERLAALLKCKNGFELAEKDLAIRGPGEFFGTAQSGLPDLLMASLTDVELIKQARQEAIKTLTQNPGLKNHPLLQGKLKKFQTEVHLE